MSRKPSVNLVADVPEAWQSEVDLELLVRLAEAVLVTEGRAGEHEVEYLVVDQGEIRRLNAQYRDRDEVTDVLSFPLHDATAQSNAFFVGPPDEVDRLGDIVVCLPRAREQALDYGHTERREQGYLFVHGLLHLLGYDHEDEDERAIMRVKEESALASVGLTR